jgi:WD40 repeat protein/HEAT repeat protein
MPINVVCACGQNYPVREEFAGQRIQCSKCGQVLTVPGAPVQAVTPPARPSQLAPPPPPPPPRQEEMEPAERRGGCGLVAVLLTVLGLLLIGCGGTAAVLVYVLRDNKPAEETASGDEIDAEPFEPDGGGNPAPPTAPPTPEVFVPPGDNQPFLGHSSPVRAVAFTRDGKSLLSASGGLEQPDGRPTLVSDNSIRVWDAASGKEVRRLRGFPNGIACAAFSPDGTQAVLGSAGQWKNGWQHGPDFDVLLWDLTGNRLVRAFKGHTRDVFAVALSADGRRILSAGAEGSIFVWDAAAGVRLHRLEGHTQAVTCLAISPDGRYALSGGQDRTVRLWDLEVGREVRQFVGHQDIVWAVAFSPDGRQAVSGGGMQKDAAGSGYVAGARDHDIRLWEVGTGRELKRFTGHREAVGALAFAPDGGRVLSGGNDSSVRLWQVSTGKELRLFEGHTGILRCVAFSPDGRRAASAGDDTSIRVWDLPASLDELVKTLEGPAGPARLEAVQDLGKLGVAGRPAVPALLKAMDGEGPVFREQVLRALKAIGGVSAEHVRELVPLLRDDNFPEGRKFALEALAGLGAEARPAAAALVEALRARDLALRIQAAKVLAGVGPAAREVAQAPLLELLRSPDDQVSAAAAAALVKVAPPTRGDVPGLARDLRDPALAMRRYAVAALAELGHGAVEAVPDLAEAVTRDQAAEVRRLAVVALLKVQPDSKAAVEAYTKALTDADVKVARQAAAALAQVGQEGGALPGLLKALDHPDPEVHKSANEGLAKVRLDRTSVPLLRQALESKKPEVRARIVAALGALGPDAAEAVPDLVRLLGAAKGAERARLMSALRKMGPAARAAGPKLAELLKDEDKAVRFEACQALIDLQAEEVEEAIPVLVKALQVESAEDKEALDTKESAKKSLAKVGKPAIRGLLKALEKDFSGGGPRSPGGIIKGAARLEVLNTLALMGATAKTPEVMQALVRTERGDPIPDVRLAAKQLRLLLQK